MHTDKIQLLASVCALLPYTQIMVLTLRKHAINAFHHGRCESGMLPQEDSALTPNDPAVSILRSTSG
jgi:hypothetical protein